MTLTTDIDDRAVGADTAAAESPRSLTPTTRMTMIAIVLALAVAAGVAWVLAGGGEAGERIALGAQGDSESVLHDNAVRLIRRSDGLSAEIDIPTPPPSSYSYPTRDLVAPWARPHPPVNPGASDAPEVFTAWLFAFNEPSSCTGGTCDFDDLGVDTAARGGSYQFAGTIADGDRLVLAGTVRLGQPPADGAPLDDALGAEVHVAIAPHGRALTGADLWRQLNGPVGNPEFWWASAFGP